MRIRSIRTLLSALLFAVVVLSLSTASFAQVGVAITIGPPPIPVYEQPLCPGDGYLWVPGYWAYDYDINDYYWVPGTWILAPEVGFLWTPGWWGWEGGHFRWWDGYWGPTVGFYGGINYGFGYFGVGFEGGRWDGGHFFYNRAVMNINVTDIHNVYNTTVINRNESHVAFNGGNGGINARPSAAEEAASHERHIGPVAEQNQHMQVARSNPQMRASANKGRPPIAATETPGELSGRGGNSAHAGNPVHPHDLPPVERPSAPNTGKPKVDQKYQQQQDKLVAKQTQERDKLQQQQEKDHQQLARQKAPPERTQQVEQRHQQQTQQLQQKHQQQTQQMQQKQAPRAPGRK